MNLQRVKKESEITLAGVTVEIENQDGSPRAITLRDSNGGLLRVTGDYGISILIPAEPKMVKKHRLSGKFAGMVDVSEDFDDEYSAKQRLREYERKFAGSDEDTGLTIAEVETPEE